MNLLWIKSRKYQEQKASEIYRLVMLTVKQVFQDTCQNNLQNRLYYKIKYMNTMNDAFNIFWLLLRKMCLSKYLEIFKQHIFQNQRQHSKLLKHRHWTEKKNMYFWWLRFLSKFYLWTIDFILYMKKNTGKVYYNFSSNTLRALCFVCNSCCFIFISSRFLSSVILCCKLSPLCNNSFTVPSLSSLWLKTTSTVFILV